MDAYAPRLIREVGIRGMIGKGYRKPAVVEAMQEYGVPYLAAVGGAGALIARSIKKYTVLAYGELVAGALAAMEVEDFPAIVVIDSKGIIIMNRAGAYRRLIKQKKRQKQLSAFLLLHGGNAH